MSFWFRLPWLLGLWLLLATTPYAVPSITQALPMLGMEASAMRGLKLATRATACLDEGAAAKGGATLAEDLGAAATRARNTVGPGSGGAYGTRVHTAFEGEVNALGQGNLFTERSYLNGDLVRRGTPGSVRLDVVDGPLDAPISVFDLKTGGATLTPARIQQIQSHVPGGANVPVFEVRP